MTSAAAALTSDVLSLEARGDGIAVLTLRRPKQLNALSWHLVDELHRVLGEVGRDDAVRVVILTGEGRGFCSGLDIGVDDPLGARTSVEEVFDRQERVGSLSLTLRSMRQPVIAAINGAATGGGLALALASDVRVASESARFNAAFSRIGLSGGDVGVSHLLPRIVGMGVASELLLTGRLIDATEADRIGLVNRVVPADELLDVATGIAAEIVANSPFGVRMTKQVLLRNVDADSLESAIELENRTQVLAIHTENGAEALSAFLEKREARFGEPFRG